MKKIIAIFFFTLLLTGCTPKVEYKLDPGKDTIEVYEEHVLEGCIVSVDDVDYEMNVISNEIDNQEIGEYVVGYKVEVDERTYTCQRVVFVIDQTNPVVTLLQGIDTIYVGELWEDAGVDVTDNYDQNVLVVVDYSDTDFVAGNPFTSSTIGTYEIHYTATDNSGNETTITRYIHIIEGE